MEKLIELKFVVAVLAMLSATALAAFKLVDGGVYATVMVGIGGAFMAAQAFAEKKAVE